jgi:hypothetical protein
MVMPRGVVVAGAGRGGVGRPDRNREERPEDDAREEQEPDEGAPRRAGRSGQRDDLGHGCSFPRL